MARLYLIPGHGQGDSGAVGGGYTEADLVRRLATRIRELGGGEVETSDYSLNCYANSGMMYWDFGSAQVVELHMDSADPSAHGAHVIYKAGYSPDAYDVALAERLSTMMPGRANSLVGRSDLKDVNQAAIRGVPYRLVEHGFISNTGDREYFLSHLDEIAQVYLDVFGISAESEDDMFTDDDRTKLNYVFEQLSRNDDVSGRGTVATMYDRVCCLGADTKKIIAKGDEISDAVDAVSDKIDAIEE